MSVFRDAESEIHGDSWLDELARASLRAAESKFGTSRHPALLRVQLVGAGVVDAYASATLTQALQDATAKVGHILRDPTTEATRATRSDRDRARLIPRGQSHGTFFFGFPEEQLPPTKDLLTPFRVASLAEAAARELVEMLPQSVEDDPAVDAVLGQRQTVRSAINDLVVAVNRIQSGVALVMSSPGEAVGSTLSTAHAEVLRESLEATRTDRRTITVKGVLDGVRTHRRIFYLEPETGPEIHGGIQPEQMPLIREYLGREVIATVEQVQIETRSGRRMRPTYLLRDLRQEEPLPEDE